MDDSELLPCPFCGEPPKGEWHSYKGGTLQLFCDNPNCPEMSISTGLMGPSETREAWNTRPIEDRLRRALALIAEIAYDRDGCATAESLGALMDELKGYADRALRGEDVDKDVMGGTNGR